MFLHDDLNKKTSLDLNFSIQNVRSLNISTKNIITEQKILAITNAGADIIFLSDLHLNSYKQIDACKELSKNFFLRGYKFFHNSVTSSRGVGILLNRKVAENIVIINIVRDTECNYTVCLWKWSTKKKIHLGSYIYGVNRDEGVSMYSNLERDIKQLKKQKYYSGRGLEWDLGLFKCRKQH
jgi:hypothetical protein